MNEYNIHILDLQSDDINNVFTITIYGKTLKNQNIVCHITDFKPFFYVKIPDNWSKNTFESIIIKIIERSFKFWEKKYINVEIILPQYSYDFYGYHWDFNNNEEACNQYEFCYWNEWNYCEGGGHINQDSSASVIQHSIIEYAEYGAYFGETQDRDLTILNSTIRENSQHGCFNGFLIFLLLHPEK